MAKQKVKTFPCWVLYEDEGGQTEIKLLSRENGCYIAEDRDGQFSAYDHRIVEVYNDYLEDFTEIQN